MKKLIITPEIKAMATNFLKDVKTLNPTPMKNLKDLRDNCADLNENEWDYINSIITNFDRCVVCRPSGFDKLNEVFPADNVRLSERMIYNGKNQALHKHIVDAMRYDEVQSMIFPKYMKRLGIRSCVYCNVQYAVSAKKGKTNRSKVHMTTYTLDHYMAKSAYPYLSVSFFNLFPCCTTCNQTKSTKPPIWSLYEELPGNTVNPYRFSLDSASLTAFLLTRKAETLKIDFKDNGQAIPSADDYDKYFHIRKIYANFKEEMEELVWRSQIYNQSWYDAFKASLPYDKIQIKDINRFIIGNYDREEDIHRRPLAKLTQEIAKQLHII